MTAPRSNVTENFERFETFEYELHRLLSRFALPPRTKTSIVRGVVEIARRQLEIEASERPRRIYASGHVRHYCPGEALETYCGRALRERLQIWRKVTNVNEVSCQYCLQGIKRDKLT